MDIIKLASVDSTNSWLSANRPVIDTPIAVYALSQTEGRGQRGNSWESEPGLNLTATIGLGDVGIKPEEQFLISTAIALAVIDVLEELGVKAKVKWPNDIYVGDKKICGILIENSILGRKITRSLAGIGLNINQEKFLSDAPNPVSLFLLTGRKYDLDLVMKMLCSKIEERIKSSDDKAALEKEYFSRLWRGDGKFYSFIDKKEDKEIKGRIKNVGRDGILTIETEEGECRSFAFKEVEFILNN